MTSKINLKSPQTKKDHVARLKALQDFAERLRQRMLGADDKERLDYEFLLERCYAEIIKEKKYLGIATIDK